MALNTDSLEDNVLGAGPKPETNQGLSGAPPPKSPLGAGSSGQTAEQAKMAGTPAQKAGAAIEADEQAKQTQETQQAAQDATKDSDPYKSKGYLEKTAEPTPADEMARKNATEFTASMQAFGSFGTKVEQIVEDSLAGKQVTEIDPNEGLGINSLIETNQEQFAEWTKDVPGSSPEQLNKAFENIATVIENTPDDPAAISKAVTEAGKLIGTANLDNMYEQLGTAFNMEPQAIKDNISAGIAEGVVDYEELSLGNLTSLGLVSFEEDFGWSEEQAEQLLGSQWKTLTPGQISEQFEKAAQAEFSEVNGLREQLKDPNLDPAQRKALQQRLQQLAASGVLGSEETVKAEVIRQEAADVFTFDDQEYDLEKFLDNDNITAIADHYQGLSDKEKDEWAVKNPGLAGWINQVSEDIEAGGAALEERLDTASKAHGIKKDIKKGLPEELAALSGMNFDLGQEHGLNSNGALMLANNMPDGADKDKVYKVMTDSFNSGIIPKEGFKKFASDGKGLIATLQDDEAMKDITMSHNYQKKLDDIEKSGKSIEDGLRSLGLLDAQGDQNLDSYLRDLEDQMAFQNPKDPELQDEIDFLTAIRNTEGTDKQYDLIAEFMDQHAGSWDSIISNPPKKSPRRESAEDMLELSEQKGNASVKAIEYASKANDNGVFDQDDLDLMYSHLQMGDETLSPLDSTVVADVIAAIDGTLNMAGAHDNADEYGHARNRMMQKLGGDMALSQIPGPRSETESILNAPAGSLNDGQRSKLQNSFVGMHESWDSMMDDPFRKAGFLETAKKAIRSFANFPDSSWNSKIFDNATPEQLREYMQAMATDGVAWRDKIAASKAASGESLEYFKNQQEGGSNYIPGQIHIPTQADPYAIDINQNIADTKIDTSGPKDMFGRPIPQ